MLCSHHAVFTVELTVALYPGTWRAINACCIVAGVMTCSQQPTLDMHHGLGQKLGVSAVLLCGSDGSMCMT